MTILTYEPIDTVHPVEQHRPDLATSQRIDCSRCGKTFVATKAVCVGGPWPLEQSYLEGWFYLFCDHCNVIHSFWAVCDDRCRITGRQTGPHITLSGHQFIAEFLRRHPQAVGVEQT